MPLFSCYSCRENYLKDARDVPCDIDEICIKTKNNIQDENEWMDCDSILNHVIYFYDKITAASSWQEFKQYNKDRTRICKFKGIDKIDYILEQFQFPWDGVDKMTMLEYILAFHNSYVGGLIGGN